MTEPLEVSYKAFMETGERALRMGSAEAAREHFIQAFELATSESERADARASAGRALGTLGRYAEAEAFLREAFQRGTGDAAVLARTRVHMGVVRWLQGDMKTARAFLEEAQAECKRLGLFSFLAQASGNLALVLLTIGEYQRAITMFTQTIEVQESLEDWSRVSVNCDNLAECYLDLGETARALPLLRRCLEIAQQLERPAVQIDPLRNLGRAQALAGNFEQAHDTIQHALKLAEGYQRRYLVHQALATLADVYLQQGDVAEAERLAQQLLVETGETKSPSRTQARLLLGRCALARKDDNNALMLLEQGLLEAQSSFEKMPILRFHAALAQIVQHPAIAEVHRRIALELAEQVADTLTDKALQQTFRQSALFRSIRN